MAAQSTSRLQCAGKQAKRKPRPKSKKHHLKLAPLGRKSVALFRCEMTASGYMAKYGYFYGCEYPQ